MKKLVLVMVFILLTAVFIAFNYLLWDREDREKELKNLELMNASNNATISAKDKEIGILDKEIDDLNSRVAQLENEKEQLTQDKNSLTEAKTESDSATREKIEFINTIKQYTDIGVISEPLKKWAEALNQGKYEEAYELEYAAVPSADRTVSLAAYTEEMQKSIKKVEISEVKIDKLRGSSEGEIYLQTRITVKLAEGAEKAVTRFSDGVNEKYVKIDYSADKKAFIIASINNY